MQKSELINEIVTALNKFQKEQKPVEKDAKNPFLQNKYASLDSIIESTRDNLQKNGLSFSQLVSSEGVNTFLFHTSGQFISTGFYKIESQVSKGLSIAQAEGVSITYTKRYQLGSILGISTDGDTDGQYGDNNKLEAKPAYSQDDKPEIWFDPKDNTHIAGIIAKRKDGMSGEDIVKDLRKQKVGVSKANASDIISGKIGEDDINKEKLGDYGMPF